MKLFPNQNFKNFDFKLYLTQKYNGLIDEDMPTLNVIKLLSSEIKKLSYHDPQRIIKVREKNKLSKKYNTTMQYWRKLQ